MTAERYTLAAVHEAQAALAAAYRTRRHNLGPASDAAAAAASAAVEAAWADWHSALRCPDGFCPWATDPNAPHAAALLAVHAIEHEGGRRSNLQAAGAAAFSRSLREARGH